MTCKFDKDCVFANQTPDCERVQLCCREKLAVKDVQIDELIDALALAYGKLRETRINNG